MRRLFYITRFYSPDSTGGVQARIRAVELLKQYFDVTVVTCQSPELGEGDGIDRIAAPGNQRALYYMERLGLVKDFLAPWAERVAQKYAGIIRPDDVVFCTSGGEMGSLYTGYLLKKKTGCKYVINLRDPSIYTRVNGMKIDRKFHVSREGFEKGLFEKADAIITSSTFNQRSLQAKYPQFESKIINNYFGYIATQAECKKEFTNKPSFMYGGRFGKLQSPELFAKVFLPFKDDIDVYFVGNYKNYKPIWQYTDDYQFIDHLPQAEYHQMMMAKANVGLLSLSSDYLGACVPAKLFDYISIGLPVFGMLPYGDAFDIITMHEYGIAKHYKDTTGIEKVVEAFSDNEKLKAIADRIQAQRESWSMNNRIQEVVGIIEKLY